MEFLMKIFINHGQFCAFMKIAELQARQGSVELEAEITDISPVRTFEKFGKSGKVASSTIKDDSGSMTLTLWNEQVDQVKVGSKIKISDGYVNEWQGEKQLTTGKRGKLEVLS